MRWAAGVEPYEVSRSQHCRPTMVAVIRALVSRNRELKSIVECPRDAWQGLPANYSDG